LRNAKRKTVVPLTPIMWLTRLLGQENIGFDACHPKSRKVPRLANLMVAWDVATDYTVGVCSFVFGFISWVLAMKKATEGKLAVVTGAAGGLGSCFASKLAQRGFSLLLVDRREQQLEQLADEITSRYGVDAEPRAMDLCDRDEVECLAHQLDLRTNLELLVNNAGFGTADYFVDADVNQHVDMIQVHVVAPTILARAALPGMIERNRGAIINVSSLAAWFYSAGNVEYAATKSYLAVFSQALQQELRGTNVRVQALCPGFVRTEFHDSECMKGFDTRQVPARYWMCSEDVVECSLRRLSGNQVVVFPGLSYRLLGRLAQMPLFQPLMGRLAGRERLPSRQQAAELATVLPPAPRVAETLSPASRVAEALAPAATVAETT
jgi:short-subunit dehydrogenase